VSKTWLIADTHWGHQGVCNFLAKDGVSKLRPWDRADDMDADMVERWNSVVGEKDRVWVLGDWAINRRCIGIARALKGRLALVSGNHDIFKTKEYLDVGFDRVQGSHVLDNILLTHIPVHPGSKGRFKGNVHGHLHDRSIDDDWYTCISVEHTNFYPVNFEEIRSKYAV